MNIDEGFASRVAQVIQLAKPGLTGIKVIDLKRAFGGNARLAWSFELHYCDGGRELVKPCILLSQVAGRHVDSDIAAEYSVLKALSGKNACTPEAIALDLDGLVTQAPAIIMERVEGNANAVAFLNDVSGASIRLTKQLAEVTANLHQCDWMETGLRVAVNPGLAQIEEWEAVFLDNRLEPHPVMRHIFQWLKTNVPKPAKLSLVHGDLRPGNFLYLKDKITALLDWEMAHIGDPAEDIAWIYRELWSPQKFVKLEDFVQLYKAKNGLDVGQKNIIFYQIFSEMKFATISLTASASVATAKSANLRHVDRAAKIPQCLALSFALIEKFNQVKSHAAA
jgi:aminoglycoside phosphotransferase (APT) family kinase protein